MPGDWDVVSSTPAQAASSGWNVVSSGPAADGAGWNVVSHAPSAQPNFAQDAAAKFRRAGSISWQDPFADIKGAAEAIAAGAAGLGRAGGSGLAGIGTGALALLHGHRFLPAFLAGERSFGEHLDRSGWHQLIDPRTPQGKAYLQLLSLWPEGAHQIGEWIFGKTGSPAAATGGEALANLVGLKAAKEGGGEARAPVKLSEVMQPGFDAGAGAGFKAPTIERPPVTGTSSGVPIKLDKLIAGAERDWQIPQPPDVKGTIRDIKRAGPQPGQQPIDLSGATAPGAGWREVGQDEALPPGSKIRMDMSTGKSYVLEPPAGRAPAAPAAAPEPAGQIRTADAWTMKDADRTATPSSTDLKELTDQVRRAGRVKKPITVTVDRENGLAYVTDGNNRLAAARAAGIEHVPVKWEPTDVPFTEAQRAKAQPLEAFGLSSDHFPDKKLTPEQQADRNELLRLLGEGPETRQEAPGAIDEQVAPGAGTPEAARGRGADRPEDWRAADEQQGHTPASFDKEYPGQLIIPRSEVLGERSGGKNRKVYEIVEFNHPFEEVLANAGRDWKSPDARSRAMGMLNKAIEQLQGPDARRFAALRKMTIPERERAARQYWQDVRTDLHQARMANPKSTVAHIEAKPAERFTRFTEGAAPTGEEPPTSGLGPSGEAARFGPPEGEPRQAEIPAASPPDAGPSLLTAVRQLGGISSAEIRDITGESRAGRGVKGVPVGLFRKEGRGVDDLVTALNERGYGIPTGEADGGVQALKDMIADEISGRRKHFAAGDEGAMAQRAELERQRYEQEQATEHPADEISDEDALDKYGPGTLGALPFLDPRAIKDLVRATATGAEKLTRPARRWVNAAQTVPESADEALATVWQYAREIAAAKEQAQRDVHTPALTEQHKLDIQADYTEALTKAYEANPKYEATEPKTYRQMVAETERARREYSRWKLQRTLFEKGFVIRSRKEAVPGAEYLRPITNYRDLTGPDGRPLLVRKDAFDVVDQMVGAHDIAEQRQYARSFWGGVEGISHGITGFLMQLPTFHIVTTVGKAIPYALPMGDRGSILTYWRAARDSFRSRAGTQDMMLHGLQPFGLRAKLEPEGATAGTVEKALSSAGMQRPYRAYQWIHKNLVANSVNMIQMAFYHMRLDQLLREAKAKGKPLSREQVDVLKATAAQDSNLIGGNLPREEMNREVRRGLGTLLFSRGLTVSTVRMLTRSLENNRIIKAYAASKGFTDAEATRVMQANRNFLLTSLALDYAVMQASANAMNYFTTSYYNEPDKNGKRGGHFVWQNRGSDESQTYLPTHIFLKPETDKDGKPTGRGVYFSTPFRTTRDIIEWAAVPFQLASGEAPKILHNKASVPVQMLSQMWSGEDWAGRPLSGPGDVAANAASNLMPSPFQDLPRYAVEAARAHNPTFLSEGLRKIFNPDTAVPTLLGFQPTVSSQDPSVVTFAVKQSQAEKKLWGRISRVKQMMRGMTPETKQRELAAIIGEARKLGMPVTKQREIARVLMNEAPSRAMQREAAIYRSRTGQVAVPPQ